MMEKNKKKNGLAKLMDSFKVAETTFRSQPIQQNDDTVSIQHMGDETDNISHGGGGTKRKRSVPTTPQEEDLSNDNTLFQWSELLHESFQQQINQDEIKMNRGGRKSYYRYEPNNEPNIHSQPSSSSQREKQDAQIASILTTNFDSTESYTAKLKKSQRIKLKTMATRVNSHGLVFAESGHWEWTRTVLRIGDDANETRDLGLALMEQLVQNIDHGNFVYGYPPQKLLRQIGFFSLVERVLANNIHLYRNEDDFTETWTHHHDRRLLAAMCCCGYQKWDRILDCGDRFQLWSAIQSSLEIHRRRPRVVSYDDQVKLTRQCILNPEVNKFLCERIKKIEKVLFSIDSNESHPLPSLKILSSSEQPSSLLTVRSKNNNSSSEHAYFHPPRFALRQNIQGAIKEYCTDRQTILEKIYQNAARPTEDMIQSVRARAQDIFSRDQEILNTMQQSEQFRLDDIANDPVFEEQLGRMKDFLTKWTDGEQLLRQSITDGDKNLSNLLNTMQQIQNRLSNNNSNQNWSFNNPTTLGSLRALQLKLTESMRSADVFIQAKKKLEILAAETRSNFPLTYSGLDTLQPMSSLEAQRECDSKWTDKAWSKDDAILGLKNTLIETTANFLSNTIESSMSRASFSGDLSRAIISQAIIASPVNSAVEQPQSCQTSYSTEVTSLNTPSLRASPQQHQPQHYQQDHFQQRTHQLQQQPQQQQRQPLIIEHQILQHQHQHHHQQQQQQQQHQHQQQQQAMIIQHQLLQHEQQQ